MNRSPQRSLFWRVCQVIARLFTTLMFDLKVWGRQHIPKDGGVLLLCNHQSYMDPVLVAVQLERPVGYMAKLQLFENNRFFSWLIRELHAFPIKRNSADVGALKMGIARLQEGNILTIYPEGTRTRTGEIGPILPGVVVMIRRAGVPVIPVAIDGAFKAWPRWRKLPHPHPIRILYGAPMNFEGLDSKGAIDLIDRTLRELLIDLRKK